VGERDHSITCAVCGLQRGGLNDYPCDCTQYQRKEARPGSLRASLHQAQRSSWTPDALKAHLENLVDAIAATKDHPVSMLDVALELLSGELKAFVLFGHIGHLDPPLSGEKFQIGILEFAASGSEVSVAIRKIIQQRTAEQENLS